MSTSLPDNIYAYYRSWNIPDVSGIPYDNKDKWLLIPANITSSNNATHITSMHPEAVTRALMLVSQTGKLLKIERSIPGEVIAPEYKSSLATLAVNVLEWEALNNQQWPWTLMFDQIKVHSRFVSRFGQNNNVMFYKSIPDDTTYRTILAKHQRVKPCSSCGGR